MKGSVISNCEKKFVTKCLNEHFRIDGRAFDEFRELKIDFGQQWGCCFVSLGESKILATVSCEIQQAKTWRPNEGLLNINVELSPMGAPNFEAGRQSELSVHLNRVLEKCIKDSRAVDLESLCIKLNEKVWALRVDLNILNYAGNLTDCASIATITALAHFKRPDVTCDGENIIIHTHKQRDPIPITIHHYPICVSYALFNKGKICVADPTLLEEGVSEAELVLGINAFKEICTLHLSGKALANTKLIYECASKAAARAFTVVQTIKQAIEMDKAKRQEENPVHFELISKNLNLDLLRAQTSDFWNIQERTRTKNKKKDNESKMEIESKINQVVGSLEEGAGAMLNKCEEENKYTQEFEDSSDESLIEIKPKVEEIAISDTGESEEEDVIILQ